MNKKKILVGVITASLMGSTLPVRASNSGWNQIGNEWVYVDAEGKKVTGWLKDGYSWYFMNDEGVMTTSTWVGSHEHWYWIGAGGVMQESKEIEYNGQRYYLKGTGVMARNYVKDGWEYDAEGVGRPLSSSNSVVINSAADLEGLETVEGNLYISEEVTEDIDLSSIDIQGKLVILKEDITVTVDDVTANGLSIQGTNSEVVLAGDTEVGTVEIERGSTLSADRSFDGTVEEIKVQSSVTEPTEISVEADKVETRTFSEVTLNEPVGEVTVVANNKITVNADVEEIQVLSSAPETVIEVTRGNKVETITADAPTSVEGNGTVGLIEANVDGTTADEDVTIEDVDKGTGVEDAPEATEPSRPSNGGGNYEPPVTPPVEDNSVAKVGTLQELNEALADSSKKTIELTQDITVEYNSVLTPEEMVLITDLDRDVVIDGKEYSIIVNGGQTDHWDGHNYAIQVYDEDNQVTLKNIQLTGADAGLLVNASNVVLAEDVDVSGNDFGGIEVSVGQNTANKNSSLTVSDTVKNTSEDGSHPTIWKDNTDNSVVIYDNGEFTPRKMADKNQIYYFLDPNNAANVSVNVTNTEELHKALNDENVTEINLEGNAEIVETEVLEADVQLNIAENSELRIKAAFTVDGALENDGVVLLNDAQNPLKPEVEAIRTFNNTEKEGKLIISKSGGRFLNKLILCFDSVDSIVDKDTSRPVTIYDYSFVFVGGKCYFAPNKYNDFPILDHILNLNPLVLTGEGMPIGNEIATFFRNGDNDVVLDLYGKAEIPSDVKDNTLDLCWIINENGELHLNRFEQLAKNDVPEKLDNSGDSEIKGCISIHPEGRFYIQDKMYVGKTGDAAVFTMGDYDYQEDGETVIQICRDWWKDDQLTFLVSAVAELHEDFDGYINLKQYHFSTVPTKLSVMVEEPDKNVLQAKFANDATPIENYNAYGVDNDGSIKKYDEIKDEVLVKVSIEPDISSIEVGSKLRAQTNLTDNEGVTYQWYVESDNGGEDELIAGATESTYTVGSEYQNCWIYVEAKKGNRTVTSDSVRVVPTSVTVNSTEELTAALNDSIKEIIIPEGKKLTLETAVNENTTLVINGTLNLIEGKDYWIHGNIENNGTINPAKSSVLNFNLSEYKDKGQYLNVQGQFQIIFDEGSGVFGSTNNFDKHEIDSSDISQIFSLNDLYLDANSILSTQSLSGPINFYRSGKIIIGDRILVSSLAGDEHNAAIFVQNIPSDGWAYNIYMLEDGKYNLALRSDAEVVINDISNLNDVIAGGNDKSSITFQCDTTGTKFASFEQGIKYTWNGTDWIKQQ